MADDDARAIPGEVVFRVLEGTSPVRAWREYRGMTMVELAGRAGLSQPFISHLERSGKNASFEVMSRIARALDIELDHLARPSN